VVFGRKSLVNQAPGDRETNGPSRDGSRENLFSVEPGAHEGLADLAATAGARLEQGFPASKSPRRRWTAWVWLSLAIVSGATGTTALAQSAGFTRWQPLVVVALAYLVCFLALTRALHTIPVGVAYAVWSGVGIVLVSGISWLAYGQSLSFGEMLGIALILAGTVVIQLYSKAVVR
jgi:small multidrug resistance pump